MVFCTSTVPSLNIPDARGPSDIRDERPDSPGKHFLGTTKNIQFLNNITEGA